MSLRNDGKRREFGHVGCGARPSGAGWARLVRDLFEGRYCAGQSVELSEIAAEYKLDHKAVLQAFAELQSLGMVSLSGNCSAVVHSPNPKEMQEAYEIRAALEEIAGRTAATALKGNTANLRKELEAMRSAANERNLDAYAKHDVKFHKSILQASQNKALLRVWDTLALELRVHAVVGKISKHLQEAVESHQPIIDALEKGSGREAGLLLRNHIETISEYLKKSESDSGFHRALRKDLEGAKSVQRAFFPPQTLSIPCISCETFYQPARGIGGDYYDFLPLQGGRWGIAIGDVSGKGISAALIMASLQASLRAQALRPHLGLHTLIADVNRLVFESSPADLFASLFYAEFEPATRILKYVNAGHNPPIVVRPKNGSCEMFHLKSTDMPVGISGDRQFAPTTFQLSVDDVVVAYTDGITEAENYHGQQWGEEKLVSLLRSCNGASSEEIIDSILEEVSVFANGQPQRDDMTLVVMTVQDGCDL
jgi:serine phosphatase RsbU (regulator of sigma subunit)/DNA-binding GntR family transcriptional regulator